MSNPAPVVTVKGFDRNMRCRGFQFEVGKTYTHDGDVEACKSGFHGCENPLDTFGYYPPGTSVYGEAVQSGSISRHDVDTKVASAEITIRVSLSISEVVTRAIAWVTAHCTPGAGEHATGDRSAASATGYRSAASATGYQSAASATGYRSAALTTGYESSAEIQETAGCKALHSVACGLGIGSTARAPIGSAIVLAERDDSGAILSIRASKVGENGVKADTWYRLKGGEFVEEGR